MDIFVLQMLTLGLVVVGAACGLLVLFGFARSRAGNGLAEALRSEADRIREDGARQARELREEVRGAIHDFQTATEAKLEASDQRGANSARELREALTGSFAQTSELLAANLKGLGEHQKERLDAMLTALAALTEKQSTGLETLRQTVESRLDIARSENAAKLDATDTKLADAARDTRDALIASFKDTREGLTTTLTGLGDHQKERLDRMLAALDALIERQANAQETLRQTVEGRLDALRVENSAKLDEMRKTVDEKLQTELEKRLGDSFRTVSEQLDRVHKGLGEMQTLATGVGDLKKVLSNVKTRGILGEVQLGMLLDQILAPSQYIANAQIKPGSFVEFAIRLPGRDDGVDVLMPIDAKFPQEDYLRLVEASERADIEGVAAAGAALETRVRASAKSIADKYISPPATTDYAILFLPMEGLFAEVVRRPGLMEQIQRDYHVTIAGPTTLTAQLSAFQMGFRSLALQKRSGEVWKLLGAVQAEFDKHSKVVDTLKKHLNAATNTIEQLGTRTNVMSRRLRDVETLPQGEAETLLGLPAPEDEV